MACDWHYKKGQQTNTLLKTLLNIYKVIIFSLMLLVICAVSSLTTFAETINTETIGTEYEIFEMEENFMEEFKDLGDCMNVKVKIYSQDNRLVRCGPEKSNMINELIKRADFLTDVGGVEIYRLSK